jgi:NRAMP (natural resistance-associated macrophage protein)-like metal ion transporter
MTPSEAADSGSHPTDRVLSPVRRLWRVLGPGIITGGADNDPAGVATYSTIGASAGLSQLWLLVVATPLLLAVQGTAARIGDVTKLGLAEVVRNEFGRHVAVCLGLLVVLANVITIAADLVAMAAVLQLVTHVKLLFFILPLVMILGYVTIFQDFKVIERLLLWLVLVFGTYVVAAFLAHPHWPTVLLSTVLPPIQLTGTYITGCVALLGTTITPYLFYWQTAAEREERRGVEEMNETYLDIGSGMVFSNLIAYFIMVATASTLYIRHESIHSAADAAKALEPIAGPFASYLFAIGILGSGLLAIPILAVSTGYVVSGTLGWKRGLGRQAHTAPGFYTVIALSLLAGVELAIIGFNPIKALYYSQVLSGLVAPVLLTFMVVLASRQQVMGKYVTGIWERIGGWAAVGAMGIADAAFLLSLVHK